MNDKEFLETADSVISNARAVCRQVLELVDELGQDRAFDWIQRDMPQYDRGMLVRMLEAPLKNLSDVEWIVLAMELPNRPS